MTCSALRTARRPRTSAKQEMRRVVAILCNPGFIEIWNHLYKMCHIGNMCNPGYVLCDVEHTFTQYIA